MFKPVDHYLHLINSFKDSADLSTLSTIDDEATSAYGYMNTLYATYEVDEQLFYKKLTIDNSKKKYTNASLHREWVCTPKGAEMIHLKRDLQVIEAILKWIKNKLVSLTVEKRES